MLGILAQIPEDCWSSSDAQSTSWLEHYCENAGADASDQTLATLYRRAPKAFRWLQQLTTKNIHSLLEFLATESSRLGLAIQVLRAAEDHSILEWIIATIEDPSHSGALQHRFDLTQQENMMVSVAQFRHHALLALAHLETSEVLTERTAEWKSEWPQTLMVARYVVEHMNSYAKKNDDVTKREIIALYLHTFLPNPEIAGSIQIQDLHENKDGQLAYEIRTRVERSDVIHWVRSKAPTIFAMAQPFASKWHEDPSLLAERLQVAQR